MVYGSFVSSNGVLPQDEHWAIIEVRSITIPGDERSRQAPGHGYPEHTENVVAYEYFHDVEVFQKELIRRFQNGYSRDRIRGIHVTEVFAPVVKVEVQKS